jgi:hypothetical protein
VFVVNTRKESTASSTTYRVCESDVSKAVPSATKARIAIALRPAGCLRLAETLGSKHPSRVIVVIADAAVGRS